MVAFCRVGNVRKTSEVQVKSIITAIGPLLTWNRGEYLRVLEIHSHGSIDREISLACYPLKLFPFSRHGKTPKSPFRRCTHAHLPPGSFPNTPK